MKRLRVAVVTNVLPHYRAAFYRALFRRDDLDLHVFCQRSIPGMNLELAHDQFPERVTLVPALIMKRESLGWQWLPWLRLFTRYDVIFVHGNLRILSGVLLASLARALGKPVVLWGQLHSANPDPKKERIRLWWWRWFDHFFLYTDKEASLLRASGFASSHVMGMNNGLDQRAIDAAASTWDAARLEAWREQQGVTGRLLVLSSARLERKNRFDLWVRAMPRVIAQHPDLLWCVIGDGQERKSLEALVEQASLSGHVRWLGRVMEERDLAPWFLSSQWLVHPGSIGLTLLHAFGYGLPVVTHGSREAHTPEFDAFEPGATGLVFLRDDEASLAETMNRALSDPEGRARMGLRGRQIAREDYNVDVMSERFVQIAWHAAGVEPRFP